MPGKGDGMAVLAVRLPTYMIVTGAWEPRVAFIGDHHNAARLDFSAERSTIHPTAASPSPKAKNPISQAS